MKRINFTAFACLVSILSNGQIQNFYWVGDSKNYFVIDSSEVLIEVMSFENAKLEHLKRDADVKMFRIKDMNTQQFVILEKGKKSFLERNSLTDADYIAYPSIRETETGAVAAGCAQRRLQSC